VFCGSLEVERTARGAQSLVACDACTLQFTESIGDGLNEGNPRNSTFFKSHRLAKQQLTDMNGAIHKLLSAAVIYLDGQPQWRHVGTVRMHMRRCSDAYLNDYLDRNWESVRHCVGCYKLEEEGVRLFSRIEGDYFSVLGLPLTELLGYLTIRGVLPE